MAEGALKNSIAQVSLSVTGIAGEDNDASHEEGIAWIAVSIIDKKTVSHQLKFRGSRLKFINYVIEKSIEFVSKALGI